MRRLTMVAGVLLGLCGCAEDKSASVARTGAIPSASSRLANGPDRQGPGAGACPQQIALNSASEAELSCLPGLGKERIADIIESRPYWAKEDLVLKKVVPPEIYDEISGRLVLN